MLTTVFTSVKVLVQFWNSFSPGILLIRRLALRMVKYGARYRRAHHWPLIIGDVQYGAPGENPVDYGVLLKNKL